MAVRMIALNQLENGQFLSRKVIPIDVRDAYARLYGVRSEAQLRQPADTPRPAAKTRHAEWMAEIETVNRRSNLTPYWSAPLEPDRLKLVI